MAETLDDATIEGMKVAELKEACRERGLLVGGKKADLQARLREFLAAQGEEATEEAAAAPETAAVEPEPVTQETEVEPPPEPAAPVKSSNEIAPVEPTTETDAPVAVPVEPKSRKRKAEDDDEEPIPPEPEPAVADVAPPPNDPVSLHTTSAPAGLAEVERQAKRPRVEESLPEPDLPTINGVSPPSPPAARAEKEVSPVPLPELSAPPVDDAVPLPPEPAPALPPAPVPAIPAAPSVPARSVPAPLERVYDPTAIGDVEEATVEAPTATDEAPAYILSSASTNSNIQLRAVEVASGRLSSTEQLVPLAAQALHSQQTRLLGGFLSPDLSDSTWIYVALGDDAAGPSERNEPASALAQTPVFGDVLLTRFVSVHAPLAPSRLLKRAELQEAIQLAIGETAADREQRFQGRMQMMRLAVMSAGNANFDKANRLEMSLRQAFFGHGE